MTAIDVGWASASDCDGAIAVLREVADYRASIGQARWDPENFTRASVGAWIDRHELVVARLDGKVVATMLLQPIDLTFWPDRPEGEALYIHKLARIRSAQAARGVVRTFVDFAEHETRASGRLFLRLDCAPDPRLCALYEGLGFTRLDVWEVTPTFVSVRWEMNV